MEKKDYDEICAILVEKSRNDLVAKLTNSSGHHMSRDIESLKKLSKDLLAFADLTTQKPYCICNGVAIVKNNMAIINKFDLI